MSKTSTTLSWSPKGHQHDATTKSKGVSPGTLSKLPALPSLGRMEHLRPATHTMLSDMSPADMGTMLHRLDQARAQYESLSGACATLAGLVCIEAKARLEHGEYIPFLKKHLGKCRDTASQYVSVAKGFLKCRPMTTFDQLTLALMDGAKSVSAITLDRSHPIVDAVCKWTNGRTFYQLKAEEAVHAKRGGNQHPKCPHCAGNLKTKKQQICPHCKKDTGAEPDKVDPKQAEAIDLWTPLLRDLKLEAIEHKSFVYLPDKGPVSRAALKGLWVDLNKALLAAERKTK
ncbi:MAG: hypothetical protein P4L99_21810 [Chthoniobacter sp.]|nr:hypothetical protein [Chthoniobacter sp.]